LASAKSLGTRLQAFAAFRPQYLIPARPQPIEPFTGKSMGQHCEAMNREFRISRDEQDDLALRSHRNAARAAADGTLADEIAPLAGVERDTGIRADAAREALAKLRPVFDTSEHGTITAGNASFPTDGAAAVCLMSLDEARRQDREPIAIVRGVEFAAIDIDDGLLMAPALAVPRLLARHGLSAADIDLFEIHEAFAAQVAANVQVWERGWAKYPDIRPIGTIDWQKVNVNGGSLAIGHPFAATGPRLLWTLASELRRRGLKRGLLSACAAGGSGCAMLIETP
jgi:acetyl-CoA acetyltransferase family protein